MVDPLHQPILVRIPVLPSVLEGFAHLGPERPEPVVVARDEPLPIGAQHPAHLAVGGGVVAVIGGRSGRQGEAELHVPVALAEVDRVVLLPHVALQLGEEVRHGLGVAPHVRA